MKKEHDHLWPMKVATHDLSWQQDHIWLCMPSAEVRMHQMDSRQRATHAVTTELPACVALHCLKG